MRRGGQLTEKIRRQPYSVILMDEIEKAHTDVFNVLLQVLDEGRLTDGHGRTVDFRNAVLIMTSNLGSDILIDDESLTEDSRRHQVKDVLKKHFRPEFLNRIDEIVIYNSLNNKQIEDIIKIQVQKLEARLPRGIRLQLDEKALSFLSKRSYNPVYGARPVRRAVQKELLNPLSKKILKGGIAGKNNSLCVRQ